MTNEKVVAIGIYENFARRYARRVEKEFRNKKKIFIKVDIDINQFFDFDFDIPSNIAFVIVYDIEQEKFLILRNEADVIKKYENEMNIKTSDKIDPEIFFNELESEFKNKFEGHEKYTQFWKKIVEEEQKEKERAREFQMKIEKIKERETNDKREKLKALGIEMETIKQIEEIMKEEL